MKKSLLVVLSLSLLVFGFAQYANAMSACGAGQVRSESDCNNTHRAWHFSCCPPGYRAQGVAYNDISKQDHVDAVSVVCRSIKHGNIKTPQDFSKPPKTFVCNNNEVLAGTLSSDVRTNGGDNRDTLDAVTALCQNAKTGQIREIYNPDFNPQRAKRRHQIRLGQGRSVGIAYREIKKGSSDRADCVTLITCTESDYKAGRCNQ